MHSNIGDGGPGQVQHHLTELDDAVVGLLDATLTSLPDAEVTDTMRRLELALRRAAAIGHRLVVESVERGLPGRNGCSSVNNYLIQTLRISVGDAARRVTAARTVGTWHTLAGQALPADLPATASAQRDGAIGSDHVEAVRHVIRKIPRTVPAADVEVAEEVLAELARSATPEDVRRAGIAVLARLNPDGSLTDEKDRARMRGLTVGRQDADLMTPIAGLLDPEARALIEPLLAKWARPGMNNPDDPSSPHGDPEAPHADRAAMAQAASRDTRTAAQRNHDALKAALRALQDSRVLGTHRGLPAATILTLGIDQLERETGVATTASGGLVPIRDALNLAARSHPVLLLFDRNGQPLHLYRTERLANADQRLALIGGWR
ncbi:DUF222 domain-containing protein [Rhodococcus kronopolitis]|uniref:DUF222 domain-containing protein n=1 Tax=Rhodococcus kronopolitis TaxID=1460226 RepID=A0ABV9FTV3_9NOCA